MSTEVKPKDKSVVKWEVIFRYSGCGKAEYFNKEFLVYTGENIDQLIKDYVTSQNKGEPKSDRIGYWSKKKHS